jgi:rhamnosyltransferase subunit B
MLLGELNYAGPMVAEMTGIPWASYILAPLSFFSAYDPPVLPMYPRLARADKAVPGMGRAIRRLARFVSRKWPQPVYDLRRELGLERGRNPLFDAKHSPDLVLALFSGSSGRSSPTGRPTPKSPASASTIPTPAMPPCPIWRAFLLAGPPPLVFTLGSAAVLAAGKFYEFGARAAERLGLRAVLLIGSDDAATAPASSCPQPSAWPSTRPTPRCFRALRSIIHQGGVGTTAQCLRAGKPMLIMPYSHDQPDNARRMRRLKVARILQRAYFTPLRVVRKLRLLLENPLYARRAQQVALRVRTEDGVATACNALEELARQQKPEGGGNDLEPKTSPHAQQQGEVRTSPC